MSNIIPLPATVARDLLIVLKEINTMKQQTRLKFRAEKHIKPKPGPPIHEGEGR
jgi:hypothetical protein